MKIVSAPKKGLGCIWNSFHFLQTNFTNNYKEMASNMWHFEVERVRSFKKNYFKQCSLCNFYSYLCNFILFPLLCSSGGLFRRKQVLSLQTLRVSSLASTNSLRYLYCLLWGIKGSASPLLTSLILCFPFVFALRCLDVSCKLNSSWICRSCNVVTNRPV